MTMFLNLFIFVYNFYKIRFDNSYEIPGFPLFFFTILSIFKVKLLTLNQKQQVFRCYLTFIIYLIFLRFQFYYYSNLYSFKYYFYFF